MSDIFLEFARDFFMDKYGDNVLMKGKNMQTTTIHTPVQIPQQYNNVEQLTEQLTRYDCSLRSSQR